MDKYSAQQLVQDTLQNRFEKESFRYLIKNILNQYDETKAFSHLQRGGRISEGFRQYIKYLDRIGQYKDANNKVIDILIVHLKEETNLERARTTQRNYIAKYLKTDRSGQLKDAALTAFVSPNQEDWRFSFIKMEYKYDKHKDKIKEKFTPALRYSFLVGPNEASHTAQNCLMTLLLKDNKPSLKDLEEAFSVEKVTKEFFTKYRELSIKLTKALNKIISQEQKLKSINPSDFAKKVLGQIVFLYFLQKKGWFEVNRKQPWGTDSKQFLRDLFNRRNDIYTSQGANSTKNFFNNILEPLFYEALGKKRKGDHYSQLDCRIPFLNGGLFEPINNYNWKKTDILLPDELFSNKNITKEGDTGDGILNIFDRYNFTVNEDEPLEKEVAIDPEMLGKVFENLLEIKDRKPKGTYYTPREIVHYMCQQSLISYLTTELKEKAPKKDIEALIKISDSAIEHDTIYLKKSENKNYKGRYGQPKLPKIIIKNALQIDQKLENIKICDPAVGSGAFPVGIMNEIIRIRHTLSQHIKDCSALSTQAGDQETEDTLKERTLYNFKRHAIEHCLYGVDIDPGAVEIAKLRLWLSLVVDEEVRDTVQPLPNLDYKIVCGNSVLSYPHKPMGLEKIEKLKTKYFKEFKPNSKEKLKKEIDQAIQAQFAKTKQTLGYKVNFDFQVNFSEVFHKKQGFDVVIANPPYDVIQDVNYRRIYKETIYGRANLYGLFIAKSIKDIAKPFGHIAFINPKTLLSDKYFCNLRKFIKNNGAFKLILKIIDRHNVFEQVLQSVIVYIFQKKINFSEGSTTTFIHEIQKKSDTKDTKNRLPVKTNKIWLGRRFNSCTLVSDKKTSVYYF